MKKIVLFITALITLSATAQDFASADDALKFLNEHFKGSTYVKTGDTWTDPVELMFDINEINIFQYRGTVSEKNYMLANKSEAAKLKPDDTIEGVQFFNWPEVVSIEMQNNNGQYWITINGPVYNDKSQLMAQSRTFYVADKANAELIKTALEDCLLEFGG